jgi:hypothetical protein
MGWFEYGERTPLRPISQAIETSSGIDVTPRGALAEVELRWRLANPRREPLAVERRFELPDGARPHERPAPGEVAVSSRRPAKWRVSSRDR